MTERIIKICQRLYEVAVSQGKLTYGFVRERISEESSDIWTLCNSSVTLQASKVNWQRSSKFLDQFRVSHTIEITKNGKLIAKAERHEQERQGHYGYVATIIKIIGSAEPHVAFKGNTYVDPIPWRITKGEISEEIVRMFTLEHA